MKRDLTQLNMVEQYLKDKGIPYERFDNDDIFNAKMPYLLDMMFALIIRIVTAERGWKETNMRLIDADALIKYIPAEEIVSKMAITNAPTIDHAYGFPLEHLAYIARVMEEEGVTPGEVAGLLQYAGKISEMVVDVMQTIREAVRRIDDDPSHPFADGVMMKE